jgi:polyisoprenoid-binding protein YceI
MSNRSTTSSESRTAQTGVERLATAKSAIQVWHIDPAHTNAQFAVRHLMISTVRGRFGAVSGTVTIDPSNPARSTADITIDVNSIDTREPQRDAHLKSADFFDVARWPTMTFRGRRVEGDPKKKFRLIGDLTIKDVTREVVLEAESQGQGPDPWGNYRAGFEAEARLDRRDFGLLWNQVLETGGFVVGDEVKITIDVELIRKAEQAAAA